MKRLNNYILEKLRINRNTYTVDRGFEFNNEENVYLMFTLVARYRQDKYIVPDFVEVLEADIDKNLLTYKCLTNFHNQKNNEESLTFKIPEGNNKSYDYFSSFIESRTMVFIKPERAKKILNDCKKNNYTLCWKQLLDENYKITNRNVFYDVYLYKDGDKLRKNSFAKPVNMEELDEDNVNLLINIINKI